MMLPGSPGLNRVAGTQIVAFKRLGVFRAGRGVVETPPFKNSRRKKNISQLKTQQKPMMTFWQKSWEVSPHDLKAPHPPLKVRAGQIPSFTSFNKASLGSGSS